MTTPEPLPCPFCGCTEVLKLEALGIVFSHCSNCASPIPLGNNQDNFYIIDKTAIEAWNERESRN